MQCECVCVATRVTAANTMRVSSLLKCETGSECAGSVWMHLPVHIPQTYTLIKLHTHTHTHTHLEHTLGSGVAHTRVRCSTEQTLAQLVKLRQQIIM